MGIGMVGIDYMGGNRSMKPMRLYILKK